MISRNNLKVFRAKNNLSQKQVSELINISRNSYILKESGKREFTLTEAKKIAELFDSDIETIFFGN